MPNTLSSWSRKFLGEDRTAVISTLNKDGSSHVTSIWYLLTDEGSLIMCTPKHSQKAKNLRRDPRIALCVGEAGRSVSFYGCVSIIEDQILVQQDLERLIERYIKDEVRRLQVVRALAQRNPVAL